MSTTSPFACPTGDFPNDPSKPVALQAALLLGHLNDDHGEGLPPAVRDGINACKRELEKLELPV